MASKRIEQANVDNGRRDGGVIDGGVMDGGVMNGIMMDGGVIGVGVAGVAGVARLERGERRNSPSSSGPRSSSISLRRLLTRLARGDSTSGGDGGGSVAVYNGGAFSQAGTAATGDGGCGHNCLSHAVVAAAARPRLVQRRRLFPAVAADVMEAGRMHVTVTVC
jgi:hypothetical protein